MNTRYPNTITTAVFPVAGLGTRFLPATKAQPKEMLPVVDKPLIQYAVEEAYAAGIRHMVFVTGRNKRAIEDHFDTAYELEAELAASGKTELMQLIHNIKPTDMDCSYVRQSRSLGLGHAVLCAEQLVGNAPFAVLLADDLMVNHSTPNAQGITAQMVQLFAQVQSSLLAVQEVPLDRVSSYGIVASHAVQARLRLVDSIVEKPSPAQTPSTLAVAGRYILTPAIFNHLRQQSAGANGEIQLTDAIAQLIKSEPVHAYEYIGKRYDCGSKLGFLEATVELALQHAEVGNSFQQFLRNLRY
ncbi:MAG: UTP--glucose-1-phosphate uridylyltransferase GalU [Polaromonas sp.]|nr:UTP--glucose-1-phosphate uridylyltransferase GalU [Polaromonas sp.]MBP6156407.1 UTP--glucose-1-phosphate uridylyltransferase GalU [Polaromonas sp.]MBP7114999.1 UTP--glucose-1-phosphate uridylyltransferase GalU [Polaromonas sp.]MBP7308592.1 UTP--glucose-1-phosphate uridylyltransferase GalU [Polaromonas sp.]MBP8874428.1 UTP--glucose-1-phosphate uridylyltransferase GalU [Polaromonas sp.]